MAVRKMVAERRRVAAGLLLDDESAKGGVEDGEI